MLFFEAFLDIGHEPAPIDSHTRSSACVKQHGISTAQRIRDSQTFERIYAQRHRAGNRHLLVFGARNDLGITRFGLSVSKRHGGAVRRVRLKRLLREAFRLSQHDLPPGLDLILIPKQNSEAGLDDYRSALIAATEKLARQLRD